MSIFLIILIVIAAVLAILLIAASRLHNEYTIERDITIARPGQEVFDYIKLIKNQANYNKWVMMDPDSKKVYTGTDGTVGFILAWDSENKQVGKGEQEIKNIIDGKQIDLAIRFVKPFEGESTAMMITTPLSGNQTRIQWIFGGKRNLMMKIFHLVMNLTKVLGKDMEISLANLKQLLEKK
jgi:hypothetical protein